MMSSSRLTIAIACLFALFSNVSVDAVNNRPIIGILTLPCESGSYCQNATSYFPASYVKSLESAGARVVPIDHTATHSTIVSLLSEVSGALFTGGGASLRNTSTYFNAVQTIYQYTLKANQQGDFFPLWGTCLGFESIVSAAYGSEAVLSAYDAENITLPLTLLPAVKNSRLFDASRFGGEVADVLNLLASQPITMNNHGRGIDPDTFAQSIPSLVALSTNVDRAGKSFVSMLEHQSYPIYATQFHPEKPQFEWDANEVIQHSRDAIRANSYFMQFFVDEARQCSHGFTPDDSSADLIYNYQALYVDTDFVQVYVFQ